MHVMVTGAGGFIGRRVVQKMRKAGWRVTGVARQPCAEAGRIADLLQPIENLPTPDTVIHLAGGYAGASAREMAETDLAIARNLLAWGKGQGVRGWILASAAEVYGPIQGAATEEVLPKPVIPYGHAKLGVERLFVDMAKDVPDSRVAILRIGEVYGSDGRLLDELAARLKSGFCPWPGSGRVPLSFVHVDDVASAFLCAAEHLPEGVSIYNVGDDEPTTWRSFVQHLAERLDARPPVFLPLPLAYAYMIGDRLRSRIAGLPPVLTSPILRLLTTPKVLSNERAKRALEFTPRFPNFRKGLEATLNGLSHHA